MNNILSKKFYEQYIIMTEWIDTYINMMNDEDFETELSPGKNHGVWILGHLITSDDDFTFYMGKGNYLFEEYQDLFGQKSRLKKVSEYPPVTKLKEQWRLVCEKNKKVYESLSDNVLDEIPENMSDEMKSYFSTKGKVVMAWQLHQMYHCGQLGVLASRTGKKMF
ncbi:MAG: DinB family protein [Ignavibacteria bacterium]